MQAGKRYLCSAHVRMSLTSESDDIGARNLHARANKTQHPYPHTPPITCIHPQTPPQTQPHPYTASPSTDTKLWLRPTGIRCSSHEGLLPPLLPPSHFPPPFPASLPSYPPFEAAKTAPLPLSCLLSQLPPSSSPIPTLTPFPPMSIAAPPPPPSVCALPLPLTEACAVVFELCACGLSTSPFRTPPPAAVVELEEGESTASLPTPPVCVLCV